MSLNAADVRLHVSPTLHIKEAQIFTIHCFKYLYQNLGIVYDPPLLDTVKFPLLHHSTYAEYSGQTVTVFTVMHCFFLRRHWMVPHSASVSAAHPAWLLAVAV